MARIPANSHIHVKDKNAVEKAIISWTQDKQFYLPEQTPICQGTLQGKLGYLAINEVSRKVLNGTYRYSVKFDQATQELLEECAYIKTILSYILSVTQSHIPIGSTG